MEKILLTTRIRNGDRKAFDELCGRYYAMLVSYARLFMKDDWAEDVAAAVLLVVCAGFAWHFLAGPDI